MQIVMYDSGSAVDVDYPLEIPGLEQGRVLFRTTGLGGAIIMDGRKLKPRRRVVNIPTGSQDIQIEMIPRRAGFDVPLLDIDGQRVEVVPAMPVAALIWALLPFSMVAFGAIGGIIGGGAVVANLALMRTNLKWTARITLSTLVTVAALALVLLFAGILSLIFDST